MTSQGETLRDKASRLMNEYEALGLQPGGESAYTEGMLAYQQLLAEHPERAIEFAVKGMLPKNPLGRRMFRKLHVFAGGEHPHQAQQPKPLEIQ